MGTFTSVLLSGSTDGRSLTVGTSAITLHACGSATLTHDEVHLYAANGATHDSVLVVMLGATTVDRHIPFTVPTRAGQYTILPGNRFTSALAISAYTATTSSSTGLMVVSGHVNRIVPST